MYEIDWVTITQICCKATVFHVDTLLTRYFCNTGESHGRCGVDAAFPQDSSLSLLWRRLYPDSEYSETLQSSAIDAEHFIPKECSTPSDASKIVKVCDRSGVGIRGNKSLKVPCLLVSPCPSLSPTQKITYFKNNKACKDTPVETTRYVQM